jgi:hypothetical protein
VEVTSNQLDLSLDKVVDLLTLHTAGTVFVEVNQLLSASVSVAGAIELEWPQEVSGGLEVGAHGDDLVDEVLNAGDAGLAEGRADHGVAADGHALATHLAKSALVDELSDGLEVGVSVGDEGLHQVEHLAGGGIHAHEHAVVDLAQTKKLQDLLHLGGNTNGTTNSDNKHELALIRDVQLTSGLGLASVVNISLSNLFQFVR